MRHNALALLLAPLLAILLTGCGFFEPDPYPPFRYRMTVEVETPQGLRTGSAVREVDYESSLYAGFGGFVGFGVSARGEAVAVDLPGGRTLYALLTSPGSADHYRYIAIDALLGVPQGSFLSPTRTEDGINPSNPAFEAAFARMLADRRVHDLPREPGHRWSVGPSDAWPLLVTFRNPADPASVERVDPDDLTTPFGPGYRIRRITLAITDDPVTETIERRLGWLPNVYRGMLPADFNPEGVPVGDYQRLFTTECCE